MSDPTKKGYADELKQTLTGIFVMIAVGLLIWFVCDTLGIGAPGVSTVHKSPSQAEIKQWEREYYENGGADPNIDVSQQYGFR